MGTIIVVGTPTRSTLTENRWSQLCVISYILRVGKESCGRSEGLKAVVTGGTGFIGSHVVDLLSTKGYEVAVIDIQPPGDYWDVPAGVEVLKLDVATPECENFIANYRPDVVFHLAARASVAESVHNPHEDARTTIQGLLHVLEGARKAQTKKVVFSSTAAVYGDSNVVLPIVEEAAVDPISPYGVSKLAAEHYLQVYQQLHHLDYAILRYANVYGPRQGIAGEGGVIAIFAKATHLGTPLRLFGNGMHTRDYIYVQDVARANLMAAEHDGSVLLNISTGVETSNRRLIELMQEVSGRMIHVQEEPERQGDILRSALAPHKAHSVIDFKSAVDIHSGLHATYRWMADWSVYES